MMNIIKHFSNLNVHKITKCVKLHKIFLSAGPASEAEYKETADYYELIATKYKASVDLHSLWLHRIWRKTLAKNVDVSDGIKILDAPAGTGLNTLKVLENTKHLRAGSDFMITMFDINPHMMKVGQDEIKKLGYNKFVNYVEGNLHNLPFDDGSFDTVITSLANRPYVDFGLVLKEINRVLKTNGKIVMLDFCFSQNPTIIQRMFFNYIRFISSKIELVTLGNLGTAEFVTRSIRDIVGKSDLKKMLREANFQKLEFKPLSLGIAELYIAFKK